MSILADLEAMEPFAELQLEPVASLWKRPGLAVEEHFRVGGLDAQREHAEPIGNGDAATPVAFTRITGRRFAGPGDCLGGTGLGGADSPGPSGSIARSIL
jgi:hypothetical protein